MPMQHFSDEFRKRREANVEAIQKAFGVAVADPTSNQSTRYRTIRTGSKVTIFTVGYEKRSGEELMSLLRDAGAEVLADVREKPMSRLPDFRAASLRQLCQEAGIEYEGWAQLGSTEDQRDHLKKTGDFALFASHFRRHVEKSRQDDLDKLTKKAQKKTVALLCYERDHEDCHRSIVADIVADRLKASIVAI